MKKIHCKRSLSSLILVWCLASPMLQAQTQEQIDKFNEERHTYFTRELELTSQESEVFWPLYEDYHNRKMKLIEDERNTYEYAHKNLENLSTQDCQETLKKIYQIKQAQLDLERDYFENKFSKALPANKVLKLGKVEWDFRRYLVRKLRNQNRESDEKSSEGSGSGRGRQHRQAPGQDPASEWAPPPMQVF